MNSVEVVLWWNKDDNNTSDIRGFLFTKNPPISKNPEQWREIGKDPTNTIDGKVKFIHDARELEIEIELVSEDELHVVFYPDEHLSDDYRENEWIMEMHIVRYFETSRKFQE